MAVTDTLAPLRARTGSRRTVGLDDDILLQFADRDPSLVEAVDAAATDPDRGSSLAVHVPSGSPSRWLVKYMCDVDWLLHITPIRLPP